MEPEKDVPQVEEEEPVEDTATFEKLTALLDSKQIEYTVTEHEPVKTSEEAAAVRGVTLASGAKAMYIVDNSRKLDKVYFLAVLSASRRIHWKRFKGKVGTKKLSLVPLEKV